jgi:hypothetical protein
MTELIGVYYEPFEASMYSTRKISVMLSETWHYIYAAIPGIVLRSLGSSA